MIESSSENRTARIVLKSGCALLLLVGVVALVSFATMGRRVERDVKRQAIDPALRLARVQELFGVDRPPAGFEVRMVADVPMLGTVGILEVQADDDEFLVERAREILLALQAESEPPIDGEDKALERLLAVRGLRLEHERLIDKHDWVAGPVRIEQRTLRATLRWQPEGGRAVLVSIAELSCRPHDGLRRLMLWIATDPAPGRELEPLDAQGTPAERTAVEQLFTQFDVCG